MFKKLFKTLFGKKSSDEDTRKIEDSCVSGQQKDVLKPQAKSDIIRIKLEVITFLPIDYSPITNS